MGALALIDALGIGQAIELSSKNGERLMATGVAPGGGPPPAPAPATTANFTQPAVGAPVTLTVTSTATFIEHGFLSVVGGGRYTVPTGGIVDGTHVTLVNIGGLPNVAPGSIVASGALVTQQAADALGTLGSSPFSLAPVFNVADPQWGAIGNGVHDDLPNFQAAAAAAALVGGVIYVPNPPVAWMISAPFVVPQGAAGLVGTATHEGQCTIRASAPMRSVLEVTSTSDATPTIPNPILVYGVTLDGANLALHGRAALSAWLSKFKSVFCINCVLDTHYDAATTQPLQFGPVTVAGGAPAGLTLSQPDTLYHSMPVGVSHVVLKTDASGTHYQTSFDGGGTFQALAQNSPASGPSNVFFANAQPTLMAGFQIHFPAGPFPVGGTWSFDVTAVNGPGENQGAINVEMITEDCWGNGAGYVYNNGTATATFAGQTLTGTATGWLTNTVGKQPRPGDILTLPNGGFDSGSGPFTACLPILGVADDTTIYFKAGDVPLNPVANGPYTLSIGWGYYRSEGGDLDRNRILRGRFVGCANGIRAAGQVGDDVRLVRVDNTQASVGCGILVGSMSAPVSGALLDHCEVKNPSTARIFIMANSLATIVEPQQNFTNVATVTDFQGTGAAAVILSGGLLHYSPQPVTEFGAPSQAVSSPFIGTEFLAPSDQSVSAPNTVLTGPDFLRPSPATTTFTIITPTGNFTNADSVVLAKPAGWGLKWRIQVFSTSNFAVGFRDQNLSGLPGDPTLSAPQIVLFAGEYLDLMSTAVSAFSTPHWTQVGPVGRIGSGALNRGSGCTADASSFVITTDAAVVPIFTIPLASFLPRGGLVQFDVSAVQPGSGNFAVWRGCRAGIDTTGTLVTTFVPTTFAQGAFGSAGGLPPGTWTPSFAVVAGNLVASVTTGAAARVEWFCSVETTACMRVP